MLFNAKARPATRAARSVTTAFSRVPVAGYVQDMGQPLFAWVRDFTQSDPGRRAARPGIINQSIAKRLA